MANTRQTFYYKVHSLELALIALQQKVARPHDLEPLRITAMGYAVLLEAARLGLAKIYEDHSILEKMNYPMP